jgi:hypothetical protein
LRRILIFLAVLAFGIGSASAEVFRSAPLSGGKFSLGLEPEIAFDGDADASIFIHGGLGVGSGYGVHAKIGFGHSQFNDDDVYIGGMFDIPLLRDGKGYPGIYLALGVSSLGKFALDNHLIVHNDFGVVTIYGGLDDAFVFRDDSSNDDVAFPIEVVFGMEYSLNRVASFLLEGGIELNDSSSFISGGVKFYLF